MLFHSIEVLHIHITCLHVYIVYIYLHLLPRTPDCVMAEARIREFFGETRIREEVLDFMGLGSCMPREAWRLPSPQPLHHKYTNVCKPHKKTASNQHAAPSDSTAAVPVPQETDMRSSYIPRPLLLVTGVHAGGPTRGVRTNQGVHTGNICVKSRDFT